VPHPDGGQGNYFRTFHTFEQAYAYVVGKGNVEFESTTGERIIARQGQTRGGDSTIVFLGENAVHGNVCRACWGFRINCAGSRIGQCTEALDRHLLGKDIKI